MNPTTPTRNEDTMTGNLPEPREESLGAAIIELDRARLPWPARWLLRDGTRARSVIADQVARRVEDRVVARVREETTDQVNASWEKALADQAAAEAVEPEPLPAFNSVLQCAKCGNRPLDPATRTHGYVWPKDGQPEAMRRYCTPCGFSWLERPLDAPGAQNGPQGDETGPGDTHIEPTDAPDTDPQPESMPQNVTSAP